METALLAESVVVLRGVEVDGAGAAGEAGEGGDGQGPLAPRRVLRLRLCHVARPGHLQQDMPERRMKCDLWARLWATSHILSELLLSDGVAEALRLGAGGHKVDAGAGAGAAADADAEADADADADADTGNSKHTRSAAVLEIGGGSGLCSLTVASMGQRVLFTDVADEAVHICGRSAEANGIAPETMEMGTLDWCVYDSRAATLEEEEEAKAKQAAEGGGAPEAPLLQGRRFHFIFGSDVCFMSRNCKPIAKLLQRHLDPETGVALVIDPGRVTADEFPSRCEDAGLVCYTLDAENVRFLAGAHSEEQGEQQVEGATEAILPKAQLFVVWHNQQAPAGPQEGSGGGEGGNSFPPHAERVWTAVFRAWEALCSMRCADHAPPREAFAYTSPLGGP